jgi:hypothetical protein
MLTDDLREAMTRAADTQPFIPDPMRATQRAHQLRHRRMATIASVATVAVAATVVTGVTARGAGGHDGLSIAPAGPASTTPGGKPSDGFFTVFEVESPTGAPRPRTGVVRVSDDEVVRQLPLALNDSTLSPDATTAYGWYAAPADGDGSGNAQSSDPKIRELVRADANWHVAKVDLRSGRVSSILSDPNQITGLSLSANGANLAYSEGRSSRAAESDVVVEDVAAGARRTYLDPTSHGQLLSPSLSPDGSQIAFTQNNAEHPATDQLEIATLSGLDAVTRARPIVPSPTPSCQDGHYDLPAWTSSGLYVVLRCGPQQSASNSIVRLDPASGRQLTLEAQLPSGVIASLQVIDTAPRPTFVFDAYSRTGLTKAVGGDPHLTSLSQFDTAPSGG